MKKSYLILIGVLAASMLSGCGVAKTVYDRIKTANTSEEVPSEADVDDDWVRIGEDAPEDKTDEDNELSEAAITIESISLECSGEDKRVLSKGVYPRITVSESVGADYPKLAESVDGLNEMWSSTVEHAVSEYGVYRLNDDFAPDAEYESDITIYILRFDENLFTVEEDFFDFSGGAHPNHGTSVINFDPVTGNALEFTSILADVEGAPKIISDCLFDQNPDLKEDITSYMTMDEEAGSIEEQFATKIADDSFSWAVLDDGLMIFFSPYEVAPYAIGDIYVTIPYDKYPGLVQKTYIPDRKQNIKKLVDKKDGEKKEVEPISETVGAAVEIENPGWKKFCVECYSEPEAKQISLKKTAEKKSDWINITDWADKNGFDIASMPYSDGKYFYELASPVSYDYTYNELLIYEDDTMKLVYDLDLYKLINGPDKIDNKTSRTVQYLRWAKLVDDMLYVSVGHNEYSKNEPDSNYIVAIDLSAMDVAWRSDALVSNARNFEIVGNTLICGYGFTAEKDYIYLLNATNGDVVDKIAVNSAPEQFVITDDVLHVVTYNTEYEYTISE